MCAGSAVLPLETPGKNPSMPLLAPSSSSRSFAVAASLQFLPPPSLCHVTHEEMMPFFASDENTHLGIRAKLNPG